MAKPLDVYAKRALWHDYTSPALYMITLKKADGFPAFAEIPEPESRYARVKSRHLPIGHIIEAALHNLPKIFNEHLLVAIAAEKGTSLPTAGANRWTYSGAKMCATEAVKVYSKVIMGDHIHFILDVREKLPCHMGEAIRVFKRACRQEYERQFPKSTLVGRSLFTEGYHDRIKTDSNHYNKMVNYINDNPRRYLLKKRNPDFFRGSGRIEIGGEVFAYMGNRFLLEEPEMAVVRFSRSFAPGEFEKKRERNLYLAANGGVMVSPFFHRSEKEIMQSAIELGGKLIKVAANGFSERWKPEGKDFDLCLEGRLLVIAPTEWQSHGGGKLSRATAMRLNRVAEEIAKGNFRVLG